MEPRTLVALDTDHIKQYVFATDKLMEIRGASSILDKLNRREMPKIAEEEFHARTVYANGGSGLFLIEGDKEVAEEFGQHIQQRYSEVTQGGASITFALEQIPDSVQDPWRDDIWDTLELLRYGLAKKKASPSEIAAFPSHPLLHLCDACGIRYAEQKDTGKARDEAGQDRRYCAVCKTKREEDGDVKKDVERIIAEHIRMSKVELGKERAFAWEKVIYLLPRSIYTIPKDTERPSDFNEFQGTAGGKDYLALIYADGNSMGQSMSELRTLADVHDKATIIDEAVFKAMSVAINKHLKVIDERTPPMFPFDILLIGGDDIMMVTPASLSLDVACTIAKSFHEQTRGKSPGGQDYSLSIGVVLAPVKYPFGLLQELAESALKFAKKEAARRKMANQQPETAYSDTIINFMTVTGSNSLDFKKVYDGLHEKHSKVDGRDARFYATLRPYTVEGLTQLLEMIREGKQKGLGRTKLHQIREAVLRMNLTTSVSEGLAILSNWGGDKREFVAKKVYEMAQQHQEKHRDVEKPRTLFPRVTFPWFADGPDTYRTSLLDFVELYDFVAQEEVEDGK